jgi:hypothetical protein
MFQERSPGRTPGGQSATESHTIQRRATPGKHTLTEQVAVQRRAAAAPAAPEAAASPSAAPAPSTGPRTPLQMLFGVQRDATAAVEDPGPVHAAAARGTATPATRLPHADQIQRAFGRHDISGIQAHVGGEATESAREMGAQAYAMGDHVVLAPGADLHTVAHEAAHVVQQRGGVHLKGGVGAVGDRYEQHADAVADLVVSGRSAEAVLDQHAPAGGAQAAGAAPVQRWVQPGEDAAANQLKDRLDGIEASATTQRDRARDLSTAVPASLRAHWGGANYITAYADANAIRLGANQAQAAAQPATRTLAQVRGDVTNLGGQLTPLRIQIDNFENHYQGLSARITAQAARQGTITDVLADGNGAAKQAEWTGLATAIQTMNHAGMTAGVGAFEAQLGSGLFSEQEVAAVRLAGAPAARKSAVIQFLTELFASGQLVLDTWSKGYPTAFDLRTGEFGAEWYLRCSTQRWLGAKWVFHAHCASTRDGDGNHTGFVFKNILGCNHLKMQSERMALGVALDLPLSAGTLAAMAAPYQEEFRTRVQDDSTFRAALRHAR